MFQVCYVTSELLIFYLKFLLTCLLQYSSFFLTKASTKRVSTTLVVLYPSNTQEFDYKSLDSIPHPLNLNLFGELLTLALAKDW